MSVDTKAWLTKHGRSPCREWRVQGMLSDAKTKPMGRFDEIVVGHWLHVEMMDNRSAFIRIGERCYWVRIAQNGAVETTCEEYRPW